MYTLNTLNITELTTEHLHQPIGIDCVSPRFGWKLKGNGKNVKQLAYQLRICALDGEKELLICDTGEKETDQSIEVQVDDFEAKPMTMLMCGKEAQKQNRYRQSPRAIP